MIRREPLAFSEKVMYAGVNSLLPDKVTNMYHFNNKRTTFLRTTAALVVVFCQLAGIAGNHEDICVTNRHGRRGHDA